MGSEVKAFVGRMGSTQKATLSSQQADWWGVGEGIQILFPKLDFYRNKSYAVKVFKRICSKYRITQTPSVLLLRPQTWSSSAGRGCRGDCVTVSGQRRSVATLISSSLTPSAHPHSESPRGGARSCRLADSAPEYLRMFSGACFD